MRSILCSHQLFLPASQVCTLREPIPFFVTLFAGGDTLEAFSAYRPSPASFHPLSSSNSSASSLQHQLMSRTGIRSPPVRLDLQRRTQVDALSADMPIVQEKTHITALKTLARGVAHTTTKNTNCVTWSGAIVLPPCVRNGGFVGSGIKVTVRSCL